VPANARSATVAQVDDIGKHLFGESLDAEQLFVIG
jgi:hypothetical protein